MSTQTPAWRKRWWIGALVLLLGAGVVWWTRREDPKAIKYETAQVDRGRISSRVTATGTLSALVTVQVGSQVSGRIQALYADFNSQVKKGQLLAEIDPQLFQAAVEQARANHLAAQGNFARTKVQAADAERKFQRAKALAERKLIALAELDTAQAEAEAAKAQVLASQGAVEQTRAALNQAQVNLTYTKIHSPIDGAVISRTVDVGQTVAASLQAPTLFTIAEDLRKMQVNTSVAEADVGKLRPDMHASFTVDAYPGERFRGTVRQIRNAPQTVQNVVTYDAVIDVENPELRLKPGMTANVTFVHAEKDDVLRVPNAAFRYRPPVVAREADGGQRRRAAPSGIGGGGAPPRDQRGPEKRSVWVLRDGQPARVEVEAGISDGSTTEIVSGELKEGDQLILETTGGEATPRRPGGGMSGGMRRMF